MIFPAGTGSHFSERLKHGHYPNYERYNQHMSAVRLPDSQAGPNNVSPVLCIALCCWGLMWKRRYALTSEERRDVNPAITARNAVKS